MIEFDAIKIAYKQDKEGYVVTFRIHPHDEHRPIADAPINSAFHIAATPLDEDGNAPEEA